MVVSWQAELEADLRQRADAALYRRRRVVQSVQGVQVTVDGKRCLNFCSNDYLGLASHPDVVSAFQRAATRCGVGSGASHLVCGHGHDHHELERELAAFTGRERAVLFSSGYLANLGVVSALLGRGDHLYQDKLNHASLLDAAALSRARLRRFRHNDLTHLADRLDSVPNGGRRMIAVDGVFSMDGDTAPLPQLASLAAHHDALLMVDDAHGLGVLGPRGAGTMSLDSLSAADVPVLMGTLGKSLGTFGAFIAGSETLVETLIQRARTYIYTTALPPAVAAATRVSLALVQSEAWRREHLQALIARLKAGLEGLPWALLPSGTPIQPLLVGRSEDALLLSDKLWERGIWVSAIRPPTVPVGSARLRITLSAAHDEQHVDCLVGALAEAAA